MKLFNRLAIYVRDGMQCVYCEHPVTNETWADFSLDHIIPKCDGGLRHFTNLVTSCRHCNTQKNDLSLDQYLEIFHWNNQDAIRNRTNISRTSLSGTNLIQKAIKEMGREDAIDYLCENSLFSLAHLSPIYSIKSPNKVITWVKSDSPDIIIHRHADQPAVTYPHGRREWWEDGVKHRIEKPAVILKYRKHVILREWWEHGKKLREEFI